MAPRRRSSGQRSQPKLFRCTGHGDCNMVFTRSEHLLRHERKHTGEKPYECVVPGCDRRFSRFDNMMQHTQTHNKNKRKAMNNKSIVQLKHEEEEPAYYHHSMVDTRTLPNPSELSLSPLQEHCNVWLTRNETLPYPYHPTIEPGNWKRRPSVSTVSSSESSVISPISATFPHCHHEPEVRRLSISDLHLPIENFNDFHHKDKVNTMNHYNSINITLDEFEALQAFSKIRSGVSLAKYSPTTDYESPNFASQVCAMRQRVMTLNESYQRC